MIISDLTHLEVIDEAKPVFGAAGTAVNATAFAVGDSSYTSSEATTWARTTSPNGGAVSVGRSTAVGIGDDGATTYTSGAADGDITIVNSVNDPMGNAPINYSRSHTVAIAVDLPNKSL